ncbi:MAG TPA: glucoronyl hydrolase [Lachnospiraceae bacterium]|nr:glucoronyl hydrolase [Lachnospiraceae bacterium]
MKWIKEKEIYDHPPITPEETEEALSFCVRATIENLEYFGDGFPYAASVDNIYPKVENRGWTTGFYTGQVWLSYENAQSADDRERLLEYGNKQVDSFYDRIKALYDVEHHDLGFLYSPSCVAACKLTGSAKAREAAVSAADKLITRFQPVGEFIQAWGEMGEADNYRFIIDCLLNLPLLYWASEETGDKKYRAIAEKHIHTAMANVLREDDSAWHTVFMDNKTGLFHHGATCQGYKDGSAWARGQAWGVYGTAMAYRYTKREEYIGYFKRVTGYFLNHLPKDLCPCWDLTFGEGDEDEPRDSSSAVIAACGMLEMSRYLDKEESGYYTGIAKRLIRSMNQGYRIQEHRPGNGLLLHGTYSKKSPYNTCTPEGVDECVIWGDYYYMEALNRLKNPDWNIYW